MPRIEYAGDIRIQRARDGVFLKRVSMDEMDRLRDGLAATRRGLPRCFALWEEANGRLSGLCYPIPESPEPCHIMYRHWNNRDGSGLRFRVVGYHPFYPEGYRFTVDRSHV